jgi:hypothetical protein
MAVVSKNCKDVLGKGDAAFEAFIPRTVSVRQAEDTEERLKPGDAAYEAFRRLADEVESRLPTFCRPTAPAVQGATA